MKYPIIITLLLLSGCAYNGGIHREYVNGQLIRQDEVGQLLFCYWTDKKAIRFDLEDIATLSIGSSTQKPDPNSIKAVTEGVVDAVIGGGM